MALVLLVDFSSGNRWGRTPARPGQLIHYPKRARPGARERIPTESAAHFKRNKRHISCETAALAPKLTLPPKVFDLRPPGLLVSLDPPNR